MIAYSRKVSSEFLRRLVDICCDLEVDPDWLMAAMAFESAGTFRPDIRNMAGSSAVGLIQFMPSTAASLGTTTDALAAMTPEDQLLYVHKYFLPYKGKLNSIEDVYMAILWPRGIKLGLDDPLFDKSRPVTYRQNSGLDKDRDGTVTKREACAGVRQALMAGLAQPNGRDWEDA